MEDRNWLSRKQAIELILSTKKPNIFEDVKMKKTQFWPPTVDVFFTYLAERWSVLCLVLLVFLFYSAFSSVKINMVYLKEIMELFTWIDGIWTNIDNGVEKSFHLTGEGDGVCVCLYVGGLCVNGEGPHRNI